MLFKSTNICCLLKLIVIPVGDPGASLQGQVNLKNKQKIKVCVF